jgi:hypothetical protein
MWAVQCVFSADHAWNASGFSGMPIGFFRPVHHGRVHRERDPGQSQDKEDGTSKYGGGINAALVGLADLAGVFWLRKRALRYDVTEDMGLKDK